MLPLSSRLDASWQVTIAIELPAIARHASCQRMRALQLPNDAWLQGKAKGAAAATVGGQRLTGARAGAGTWEGNARGAVRCGG